MPLLRTVAAAVAAACLFISAQARPAAALAHEESPRAADVKKAEKIIVKLRRVEQAGDDFGAYRRAVESVYPNIFDEVASLGDGNLKTDLSTAVFLYEAAYRLWRAGDTSVSNCDSESRDLYRKLCREQTTGTRSRLLRAKARLHTRWAESQVAHARGQRDAKTLSAVAEMRAERSFDLALAARAVEALRSLECDVRAYDSLADFEESRTPANVSFKEFTERAAEHLHALDRALASLPRSSVRQSIQNARNSYRDGLFWWQKTEGRDSLTISADALAEVDQLDAARINTEAARYTVVVNWRNAARYTSRAEELVRSSSGGDIASRIEF